MRKSYLNVFQTCTRTNISAIPVPVGDLKFWWRWLWRMLRLGYEA